MITENKTKTIQVRVSESDHRYILVISQMVGMTPSQYVRSLIQATVNAAKVQEQKGAFNIEDFEGVFNDKL